MKIITTRIKDEISCYYTSHKITRVLATMDHSYLYDAFNVTFPMTSIFPTIDEIELSKAVTVYSRKSPGIERTYRRCK